MGDRPGDNEWHGHGTAAQLLCIFEVQTRHSLRPNPTYSLARTRPSVSHQCMYCEQVRNATPDEFHNMPESMVTSAHGKFRSQITSDQAQVLATAHSHAAAGEHTVQRGPCGHQCSVRRRCRGGWTGSCPACQTPIPPGSAGCPSLTRCARGRLSCWGPGLRPRGRTLTQSCGQAIAPEGRRTLHKRQQ